MYQENELKKLYERLKTQYPQYQLELSGDSLILKRLYCKVEVNRSGVKLYVNGNLYDQFTSEYVDDSDDLYELIEAFLLDLQHAGMKQGNETYIAATKQATKMGSHFLIGTALCLTILMIGLITTNSPDCAVDPSHAETNALKRRLFHGDHWTFCCGGTALLRQRSAYRSCSALSCRYRRQPCK